jgi:DNA-binding PadR family transcriptional regulator
MSPRDQLIKGHVDLLLLAALEEGPGHGYSLIQRLRFKNSEFLDLPQGTVYPTLHRLEQAGLVSSGWERRSGRKLRVYALSPKGREALGLRREEWCGFTRAVGTVLGVSNV